MTGRPPQPKLTPAKLEEQILQALRAAGGSSQRNNLRAVIRPVISAAEFDRAIARLSARGEVTGSQLTLTWRSHRGMDLPYKVVVYSLPKGRRRRPSPMVKPLTQSGPHARKAVLSVSDIEEKIVTALREAGGSKGRTALRTGISPTLSVANFDAAVSSLVRRRLVTEKVVMTEHQAYQGYSVKRRMTLYTLAASRKRSK